MDINLRRTRRKLALFEQEGLNELLFDLLDDVAVRQSNIRIPADKLQQAIIIKDLRDKYLAIIAAFSKDSLTQKTLFDEEQSN